MKNRLLALLLALLMLGATACGDPTADSAGNTSAGADTPAAEEAETEPEDTSVKTALPDDLDFAGAFYRIHNLGDTLFCGTIRDGVFAGKFKNNDVNLQSTLKSLTKISERTINNYVEAFDKLEQP